MWIQPHNMPRIKPSNEINNNRLETPTDPNVTFGLGSHIYQNSQNRGSWRRLSPFWKNKNSENQRSLRKGFLKVNVKSKFTKFNNHMFLGLNISLDKIPDLVGFLTNDIYNISGNSSFNSMYS